MWTRLKKISKSFYFIVSVLFLAFVVFIDSNDVFTQIALEREHHALKETRHRYQQKIKDIQTQHKQLNQDTSMWERIARERYLLRKPSEEVFVIEDVRK